MCGICGKIAFGNKTVSKELVEQMCRTLAHRGPDAQSVHVMEHVGLGQRRLSIIDLHDSACPPLSNEDGTLWIVFNGEIYNFVELREDLTKKGHRFTTKTDTEVIVHLYEEEGVDCLHRLKGMFAFAIWDSAKEIIFCARDRFGKKPFCYALIPGSFIFGSEIKAITADPDVSTAPNYRAIDLFLTYQYVPSPFTAFKGIRRLMPGEYLTCDIRGNLTTVKYWTPKAVPTTNMPHIEIEHEIIRRLRQAVKARMIADVPLGAFLSGGIDSSIVTALMAEVSSNPVKTFSIGFDEQSHDERPYARLVADRFGTDHHEFVVKPELVEALPILVKHYNEPFADYSAIPTYYLSKMTRSGVTVALSGDGGDESFSGYDNYWTTILWNRGRERLKRVLPLTAGLGRSITRLFPLNNLAAKFSRTLLFLGSRDLREIRLALISMFKEQEKTNGYSANFSCLIEENAELNDPVRAYPYSEELTPLDWISLHDLNFYLPDCLMVKTDIASMAHGLEVRCPFLDHELTEFLASIPSELKRNSREGKQILKKAALDILPKPILSRPKKGFGVPMALWLRKDLSELLTVNLSDAAVRKRNLFKPLFVKKMVDEHLSCKRDWSNRLYALLFLELWFQEFLD